MDKTNLLLGIGIGVLVIALLALEIFSVIHFLQI